LFIIVELRCPGQNKRIAPLPFFYGCRKRRLKELIALTLELDGVSENV
jgi:hypothetical protein